MFKIVFFDLDGTLLNSDKEVLKENKIAIQNALNNGIEVCICTGRQKDAAKRYQKMAGAGRYIICENGAEIYDTKDNEELFNCALDKDFCLKMYEYIMKNDLFVRIDTKYARYINKMNLRLLDEVPIEEDYKKLFAENDIFQMSIGSTKTEDIDKVVELLDDSVKVENRFMSGYLPIKHEIINVINSSVSKGNAILGLCKYLKIKPEEAMAFGDDLNDISMMESVYGVAMGNAYDVVKDMAKEVVSTTNNEAGIAKILNRIVQEKLESKE